MASVSGAELLIAAGVVLTVASLAQSARPLRAALALTGAMGLGWAIVHHRALGIAAVSTALLIANVVRLVLGVVTRYRTRLVGEEAVIAERYFAATPPGLVRQLLDQGLWIHGKEGEVLTREGEPVSHLFYLAEGEVSISSGGRPIATSGPGHFFGEITVIAGSPAVATLTLASEARFWCITAAALREVMAVNPELRPALEIAFATDLRDKIRLTNRRLIELEGG